MRRALASLSGFVTVTSRILVHSLKNRQHGQISKNINVGDFGYRESINVALYKRFYT
jgi:hypothetical protein